MTMIPDLALTTATTQTAAGSTSLSLWSVPGAMVAAACWYSGRSVVTATLRRGMRAGATRLLNLIAGGSLIGFGAVVGRDLFETLLFAPP